MADWNLVATLHLLLGCTKMVRRMHGISILEFVNCWWQILYIFLLYIYLKIKGSISFWGFINRATQLEEMTDYDQVFSPKMNVHIFMKTPPS